MNPPTRRPILRFSPFLRVLASPTLRDASLVAALVLVTSLLAGLVRVAPLLLAPSVPVRLAIPFARAALAVSLEVALLVAPSIGAALAAARLVDRGEARAVFALGASPRTLVASAFPVWLLVAALSALASLAWGREAEAPGRLASRLLDDGRTACLDRAAHEPASPHAVAVPLTDAAWICLPSEPPRLVMNPPALGGAAIAARDLVLAPDTSSLVADDLILAFPPSDALGPTTLRVDRATVRGLLPLGRASNLPAPFRALLLGASTSASALLACFAVLISSITGRALALFVGLSGPLLALLGLSMLEPREAPLAAYGLLPLLASLGPLVAARLARLVARRSAHRA